MSGGDLIKVQFAAPKSPSVCGSIGVVDAVLAETLALTRTRFISVGDLVASFTRRQISYVYTARESKVPATSSSVDQSINQDVLLRLLNQIAACVACEEMRCGLVVTVTVGRARVRALDIRK